jgi:hypothetical protein
MEAGLVMQGMAKWPRHPVLSSAWASSPPMGMKAHFLMAIDSEWVMQSGGLQVKVCGELAKS